MKPLFTMSDVAGIIRKKEYNYQLQGSNDEINKKTIKKVYSRNDDT